MRRRFLVGLVATMCALATPLVVGAGLLAAALPARRAARLNVLEALHYE